MPKFEIVFNFIFGEKWDRRHAKLKVKLVVFKSFVTFYHCNKFFVCEKINLLPGLDKFLAVDLYNPGNGYAHILKRSINCEAPPPFLR